MPDDRATFYIYRLAGAPRDHGYIVALAELPLERNRKEGDARRRPLIWTGIARDADHALELAKRVEEKNAKPEARSTETL